MADTNPVDVTEDEKELDEKTKHLHKLKLHLPARLRLPKLRKKGQSPCSSPLSSPRTKTKFSHNERLTSTGDELLSPCESLSPSPYSLNMKFFPAEEDVPSPARSPTPSLRLCSPGPQRKLCMDPTNDFESLQRVSAGPCSTSTSPEQKIPLDDANADNVSTIASQLIPALEKPELLVNGTSANCEVDAPSGQNSPSPESSMPVAEIHLDFANESGEDDTSPGPSNENSLQSKLPSLMQKVEVDVTIPSIKPDYADTLQGPLCQDSPHTKLPSPTPKVQVDVASPRSESDTSQSPSENLRPPMPKQEDGVDSTACVEFETKDLQVPSQMLTTAEVTSTSNIEGTKEDLSISKASMQIPEPKLDLSQLDENKYSERSEKSILNPRSSELSPRSPSTKRRSLLHIEQMDNSQPPSPRSPGLSPRSFAFLPSTRSPRLKSKFPFFHGSSEKSEEETPSKKGHKLTRSQSLLSSFPTSSRVLKIQLTTSKDDEIGLTKSLNDGRGKVLAKLFREMSKSSDNICPKPATSCTDSVEPRREAHRQNKESSSVSQDSSLALSGQTEMGLTKSLNDGRGKGLAKLMLRGMSRSSDNLYPEHATSHTDHAESSQERHQQNKDDGPVSHDTLLAVSGYTASETNSHLLQSNCNHTAESSAPKSPRPKRSTSGHIENSKARGQVQKLKGDSMSGYSIPKSPRPKRSMSVSNLLKKTFKHHGKHHHDHESSAKSLDSTDGIEVPTDKGVEAPPMKTEGELLDVVSSEKESLDLQVFPEKGSVSEQVVPTETENFCEQEVQRKKSVYELEIPRMETFAAELELCFGELVDPNKEGSVGVEVPVVDTLELETKAVELEASGVDDLEAEAEQCSGEVSGKEIMAELEMPDSESLTGKENGETLARSLSEVGPCIGEVTVQEEMALVSETPVSESLMGGGDAFMTSDEVAELMARYSAKEPVHKEESHENGALKFNSGSGIDIEEDSSEHDSSVDDATDDSDDAGNETSLDLDFSSDEDVAAEEDMSENVEVAHEEFSVKDELVSVDQVSTENDISAERMLKDTEVTENEAFEKGVVEDQVSSEVEMLAESSLKDMERLHQDDIENELPGESVTSKEGVFEDETVTWSSMANQLQENGGSSDLGCKDDETVDGLRMGPVRGDRHASIEDGLDCRKTSELESRIDQNLTLTGKGAESPAPMGPIQARLPKGGSERYKGIVPGESSEKQVLHLENDFPIGRESSECVQERSVKDLILRFAEGFSVEAAAEGTSEQDEVRDQVSYKKAEILDQVSLEKKEVDQVSLKKKEVQDQVSLEKKEVQDQVSLEKERVQDQVSFENGNGRDKFSSEREKVHNQISSRKGEVPDQVSEGEEAPDQISLKRKVEDQVSFEIKKTQDQVSLGKREIQDQVSVKREQAQDLISLKREVVQDQVSMMRNDNQDLKLPENGGGIHQVSAEKNEVQDQASFFHEDDVDHEHSPNGKLCDEVRQDTPSEFGLLEQILNHKIFKNHKFDQGEHPEKEDLGLTGGGISEKGDTLKSEKSELNTSISAPEIGKVASENESFGPAGGGGSEQGQAWNGELDIKSVQMRISELEKTVNSASEISVDLEQGMARKSNPHSVEIRISELERTVNSENEMSVDPKQGMAWNSNLQSVEMRISEIEKTANSEKDNLVGPENSAERKSEKRTEFKSTVMGKDAEKSQVISLDPENSSEENYDKVLSGSKLAETGKTLDENSQGNSEEEKSDEGTSGGEPPCGSETRNVLNNISFLLNGIEKKAEQRLAAKRAARSEAREIRMRELERKQQELEEQQKEGGSAPVPIPHPRAEEKDRHYEIMAEHRPATIRQMSTSSFSSSRRSSTDSIDNDKDLKSLVQELEEKYKKAAMSNAQLDNEKQTLKYQVDHFKDSIDELEELYTEAHRQFKDKARDLDFQKRLYKDLEHDVEMLKEQIKQRDKLIEDHGLVLVGVEDKEKENGGIAALVSPETAQLLEQVDGSLDERIKQFIEERRELQQEIKRLKEELEEVSERNSLAAKFNHPESPKMNGPDMEVLEIQREANKQVSDYKFKLQKAEQDITNLEGNVMRLESQVKRYKASADNAEKLEDELKTEKRKLTRELREAQVQIEELQTQNSHLQKRLEKLKSSRNALLK